MNITKEATLYRPNAGIIIFNKKGKLLWCKRKTGDGWQFPQGGIDEGESPEDAILRET
jgi:putative (di)nucleoside polyphosphate hydrolase